MTENICANITEVYVIVSPVHWPFKLKGYLPAKNLDWRFVITEKLFYSILPFRVLNHLFCAPGLSMKQNMCRFCTKIYIKHKNTSKYINDNLFIQITEFIPVQFSYGIITGGERNLFVRSSVCERQKYMKLVIILDACSMSS